MSETVRSKKCTSAQTFWLSRYPVNVPVRGAASPNSQSNFEGNTRSTLTPARVNASVIVRDSSARGSVDGEGVGDRSEMVGAVDALGPAAGCSHATRLNVATSARRRRATRLIRPIQTWGRRVPLV